MLISKGYVTGEVFPIIQYIDKFTEKAKLPDKITKIWNGNNNEISYSARKPVIVYNDKDLQ